MRTLSVTAQRGDAGRVRVLLAGIALSQRDPQVSSHAALPEEADSPEGTGTRERRTCARHLGSPDA
jgi:hypothetical protein